MKKVLTYIILLWGLFFLTCTKVPSNVEGTITISGIVELEGETDFSGVTVSLYAPVELDTAIVNMQQRFPNVGFPISQQTEFDHRLETPLYTTMTKEDGSFSFNNVTEDEYNLVVEKKGFGWFYAINGIIKKALNVILYPEIIVNADISSYSVWEQGRHYILKSDLEIKNGATLLIDNGATVRCEKNIEIRNFGKLIIAGEKNKHVLFTLNQLDGQDSFWKGIKSVGNSAEINCNYASIKHTEAILYAINTLVNISNSNHSNSIWGYQINNTTFKIDHSIFQKCQKCIETENLASSQIENNIFFLDQLLTESYAVQCMNETSSLISKNIIYGFDFGINTMNSGIDTFKNNYLKHNNVAFRVGSGENLVFPNIELNTIEYSKRFSFFIYQAALPVINHNNVIQELTKDFMLVLNNTNDEYQDINAINNFWNSTFESEIRQKIIDERVNQSLVNDGWTILIKPFNVRLITDAYPY